MPGGGRGAGSNTSPYPREGAYTLACCAALLLGCYGSHERDDRPPPVPTVDAGASEPWCRDDATLTLTIRDDIDCTSGWVEGTGAVGFDPSGTPVRLVREIPREGLEITLAVLDCPPEGSFRVWEVSSSMSECDNAMSWAPETCEPGQTRTRTWRWTAGERRTAELLFAGEARFEVSLCR